MAENREEKDWTEQGEPILKVEHLTKLYGSANRGEAARLMKEGKTKAQVFKETGVTAALWDVNFQVKRGEVFVIIGLSGSGKSTVIRCLNLLNKPSGGKVYFEGTDIRTFGKQELRRYRRNKISMVFQNFGLMSHRDVLANVVYGLEVKGMSRAEREKKALEMIEMVGLKGHEHTAIASLSGGMRQRVGIARALASDPEVLLMDEPFSALDPLVRKDMQFELLSLQRKLEKTIVFITHDINEAFKLGDTVAIMRDGKLIQVGTPEEMSANPADDYVKEFVGSADMTKVLCARNIMITPCVVRRSDSPEHALREMKTAGVSTAYVVDRHMKLLGIVNVESAIRAHREGKTTLHDVYTAEVETTTENTVISEIIPVAAEIKYPIAVIEPDGSLKGIVSKASVLSSLL